MANVRPPRPSVRPRPEPRPEEPAAPPPPEMEEEDREIEAVTTDVARAVKEVEQAAYDAVPLVVSVFNGLDKPFNLMTRSARFLLNPHEVSRIPADVWAAWQKEMGDNPLKDHIVESK